MNRTLHTAVAAMLALAFATGPALAIVNDSRSYAIEAALPWLEPKEGSDETPFALRDSWWTETTKVKEPKIFSHQLFKRNEYWFWVATDDLEGTVSVAVYDAEGKLVEPLEKMSKKHTAGVRVAPTATGTYYVRVVVETATGGEATWAVVYGYR